MNSKGRWYELLLATLAALVIMASGIVQSANAEYVEGNPEPYYDDSDDYNRGSSTYTEKATSTSDATSGGSCSCYAYAKAWAKGNSASADADSYGTWLIDWAWNGPPGEAPGGSLDWSQWATGTAGAWANNYVPSPSTQWATSASSGDSESWSTGTEGSAYADVGAWGYAEDGDTAGGDTSGNADPTENLDPGVVNEYDTPPDYAMTMDGWSFSASNEEGIASGTTYVYFAGGATCDAAASAGSGGTGEEATAEGDASVSASVGADFYSN